MFIWLTKHKDSYFIWVVIILFFLGLYGVVNHLSIDRHTVPFILNEENTLQIFQNSIAGEFIENIVYSILIFVPSVWELAAIAVGLNMFFRLILALRFKHPVWQSVLLQPLAILWIIFIGIESYFRIKGGGVRWKGRIITVQQ